MANLITLKRKIRVAKNIAKTTRAMQMVAASKTKRAQENTLRSRPYADRFTLMVKNLAGRVPQDFVHPFLAKEKSDQGKTLLVVLSPDKGLCGSLISNLTRELLSFKKERNPLFLTVGKKLATRVTGDIIVADFPMGISQPTFEQVTSIMQIVQEGIKKGEFSQVYALYAKFESLFLQQPVIEKLIPIEISQSQDMVGLNYYLFEPNAKDILESILPHYVENKLYQLILESFASEQVARMIAMQNATDNAQDVISQLSLVYNKARQERITNEILDVARASSAINL